MDYLLIKPYFLESISSELTHGDVMQTLKLPYLVRGDTMQDVYFSVKLEDSEVLSSRCQLRCSRGTLLHEFELTVNSSDVILQGIPYQITSNLPIGKVFFDLELIFDTLGKLTVLKGEFEILEDITHD